MHLDSTCMQLAEQSESCRTRLQSLPYCEAFFCSLCHAN